MADSPVELLQEIRELLGDLPSRLAAELADFRPPAPAQGGGRDARGRFVGGGAADFGVLPTGLERLGAALGRFVPIFGQVAGLSRNLRELFSAVESVFAPRRESAPAPRRAPTRPPGTPGPSPPVTFPAKMLVQVAGPLPLPVSLSAPAGPGRPPPEPPPSEGAGPRPPAPAPPPPPRLPLLPAPLPPKTVPNLALPRPAELRPNPDLDAVFNEPEAPRPRPRTRAQRINPDLDAAMGMGTGAAPRTPMPTANLPVPMRPAAGGPGGAGLAQAFMAQMAELVREMRLLRDALREMQPDMTEEEDRLRSPAGGERLPEREFPTPAPERGRPQGAPRERPRSFGGGPKRPQERVPAEGEAKKGEGFDFGGALEGIGALLRFFG